MIYLEKKQLQLIIDHCQEEYPKEACGILAGVDYPESFDPRRKERDERVSKVYKMTNTSESPQICYFMQPEEQFKVFKEMRKLGIEMQGIYHSHSETAAYPSKRDCEMAFYPEVSYVIVSLQDFDNPIVRSFKIVKDKIEEEKIIVRKNILFVCLENSCRSQIAEAIVNSLYWQNFFAYSAGSKPSGIVNSLAIKVMKEMEIDISGQKSKGFDKLKDIEFDYVITMGCGDVCPVYPAKKRFNWQMDDPRNKPIEFFRKVRDEIRKKIQEL